jgi:FtsZ-binding cell division protein ZapB
MVYKCNRFLNTFLAVCLSIALLLPSASATDVPSTQESMDFTIERGSSHSFFLLVSELSSDVTLSGGGDIGDWISFGDGKLNEIKIPETSVINIVLVTIDVPDGIDLDEYDGVINENGRRLSLLRVKVTLDLSDAKSFEQLSDVDKEVTGLQEKVESLTGSLVNVRSQLATLEKEVSDRMEEIYKYQRDVTALEDEKARLEAENQNLDKDISALQEKSAELEESNTELNQMTGMLVGTQLPGMFFAGIMLGVVSLTLVVKREHFARKIRAKLKGTRKHEPEERFRYSYSK